MESGNVFNLQDFEQNKIPLKQRSFEGSIDTFFSLFDVDLLLIWINKFRHGFHFRSASCPVLHIVLIISQGECSFASKFDLFCNFAGSEVQKVFSKHVHFIL